jgi:hypothetical protein
MDKVQQPSKSDSINTYLIVQYNYGQPTASKGILYYDTV